MVIDFNMLWLKFSQEPLSPYEPSGYILISNRLVALDVCPFDSSFEYEQLNILEAREYYYPTDMVNFF
jgi:hypothetical protein